MGFPVSFFLVNAVLAIHEHWADLAGQLDDEAREELMEILADVETDPAAAARDLREVVKPFVPPGHPLRDALVPSGVRYRPTALPPDTGNAGMLTSLRALRGRVLAAPDPPESTPPYRPDADDAWLLAAPALAPDAVRQGTAHDDYVIVLSDENDAEHIPAFQFDPESGAPYPVVIEINRLLSADVDPWGAADWWLGPNLWLRMEPARLLGTGADDTLLSAAEAVLPDW